MRAEASVDRVFNQLSNPPGGSICVAGLTAEGVQQIAGSTGFLRADEMPGAANAGGSVDERADVIGSIGGKRVAGNSSTRSPAAGERARTAISTSQFPFRAPVGVVNRRHLHIRLAPVLIFAGHASCVELSCCAIEVGLLEHMAAQKHVDSVRRAKVVSLLFPVLLRRCHFCFRVVGMRFFFSQRVGGFVRVPARGRINSLEPFD